MLFFIHKLEMLLKTNSIKILNSAKLLCFIIWAITNLSINDVSNLLLEFSCILNALYESYTNIIKFNCYLL